MKIKQVEELVGITRKNIRFYEEQGLLNVERAENGYREYHTADNGMTSTRNYSIRFITMIHKNVNSHTKYTDMTITRKPMKLQHIM